METNRKELLQFAQLGGYKNMMLFLLRRNCYNLLEVTFKEENKNWNVRDSSSIAVILLNSILTSR